MVHTRIRRDRLVPAMFRTALGIAAVTVVATAPSHAAITSAYVRTKVMTLAPGITWELGTATTSKGVQAIQVGRIDMQHPQVRLRSLLSNDRVVGLERPSLNADRNSRPGSLAIIATNGDVSKEGDAGAGAHPPSIHVRGGEVMVGTSCGRPTLGVDADGTARMASVRQRTTLDMTSVIPGYRGTIVIRGINRQGRDNQLLLFTERWGPRTLTTRNGTDVVIRPTGIVRPTGRFGGIVEKVTRNTRNSPIPPGRMVLSGDGDKATILSQLAAGDQVAIETAMYGAVGNTCSGSQRAPEWDRATEVMGGNWFTALNGRNAAPTAAEYPDGITAAARTNVGITATGDILLVVVYDTGMSLRDMGDLMLQLGAVTAFNLDGGGSSVMATRKVGAAHLTVTYPSARSERAVTQAPRIFSIAQP